MIQRFLIPVVITLVAKPLGKWLDNLRGKDSSPSYEGYCTWCGKQCRHDFYKSGLKSKNATLAGGFAVPLSGLVLRDIYRCSACKQLTVPCQRPGCNRMACSWDFYDHELCGKCVDGKT